jgi:hypothetical protein
LHLWPPIFAVTKKHCNLINAFHSLKTFHKKLGEVNGTYDKLNRGSLYKWFTPRGEIKPHLKNAIKKGIISIAIRYTFFNSGTKIEK